MYKSAYFLKQCGYIEIGKILSGLFLSYKTVWIAKPCKILNIRSGLNINDSVLSLCGSLTPNINKAIFKESLLLSAQELILNFKLYLPDPCLMWYLRTLSPSHIMAEDVCSIHTISTQQSKIPNYSISTKCFQNSIF